MPWLSARGDLADRLPGGVRKLKDFDIDGSMRYLFRASPSASSSTRSHTAGARAGKCAFSLKLRRRVA